MISFTLAAANQDAEDRAALGTRHALILVGLPGDQEHAERFAALVDVWQSWLTESLGYPQQHILRLQGREGETAATKENVTRRTKKLLENLNPPDTLWVIVLGHADEDARSARLHLPGPDIDGMEFADLFADVPCREQVFWLTHTCSSHFLRPLSQKGRIVITATAPDEGQNETEFPEALSDVASRDVMELDQDGNHIITLAELFLGVASRVAARYAADNRIPTEHTQLDDDGDGRGTEAEELSLTPPADDLPRALRRDGAKAAALPLPWKTTRSSD
jgi:hypothetical protein